MAKVQRVTYFKTSIEDTPGSLLAFLAELKSKKVGLAGLWGFGVGGERATLFIVAKNLKRLKKASEASGIALEEGTGFLVTGKDRTGALIKTLKTLSKSGINIQAMDTIAIDGRFGGFIWVDPAEVDKAAEALDI